MKCFVKNIGFSYLETRQRFPKTGPLGRPGALPEVIRVERLSIAIFSSLVHRLTSNRYPCQSLLHLLLHSPVPLITCRRIRTHKALDVGIQSHQYSQTRIFHTTRCRRVCVMGLLYNRWWNGLSKWVSHGLVDWSIDWPETGRQARLWVAPAKANSACRCGLRR